MNEYEIMIKNLENRVTELEKQLFAGAVKSAEPVKWQPKGGDWRIDVEGNAFEFANNELSYYFGTARQTQEQAEHAAVEMRRFNRLLALRDELCGDEVVDWGTKTEKFIVYFSHYKNGWFFSKYEDRQDVAVHFVDLESAKKACDMLNSAEVEL